MNELEFLVLLKLYIERMEETVDGEWGDGRSIAQLISDGEMPQPIYSEVIRRIEALTPAIEESAAQ
jgi:hypothetical protein